MQLKNVGRPSPFATSYIAGKEDKRMNNRTMLPTLQNNASAGYQGPVKIELLKSAGLLKVYDFNTTCQQLHQNPEALWPAARHQERFWEN